MPNNTPPPSYEEAIRLPSYEEATNSAPDAPPSYEEATAASKEVSDTPPSYEEAVSEPSMLTKILTTNPEWYDRAKQGKGNFVEDFGAATLDTPSNLLKLASKPAAVITATAYGLTPGNDIKLKDALKYDNPSQVLEGISKDSIFKAGVETPLGKITAGDIVGLGTEMFTGGAEAKAVRKGSELLGKLIGAGSSKIGKEVFPEVNKVVSNAGIELGKDVSQAGSTIAKPIEQIFGYGDTQFVKPTGLSDRMIRDNIVDVADSIISEEEAVQKVAGEERIVKLKKGLAKAEEAGISPDEVGVFSGESPGAGYAISSAKRGLGLIATKTQEPELAGMVDKISIAKKLRDIFRTSKNKHVDKVEKSLRVLGLNSKNGIGKKDLGLHEYYPGEVIGDNEAMTHIMEQIDIDGNISEEGNKVLNVVFGQNAEKARPIILEQARIRTNEYFEDAAVRMAALSSRIEKDITTNFNLSMPLRNKIAGKLAMFKNFANLVNKQGVASNLEIRPQLLNWSEDIGKFRLSLEEKLSNKEKGEFRKVFKNIEEDFPSFKLEQNYVTGKIKKGSSFEAASSRRVGKGGTVQSVSDMIYKQSSKQPGQNLEKGATPLDRRLREMNWFKLEKERQAIRAHHTYITPVSEKMAAISKRLGNIELLNAAERKALEAKIGLAFKDIIENSKEVGEAAFSKEALLATVRKQNIDPAEAQYVTRILTEFETELTDSARLVMKNSVLPEEVKDSVLGSIDNIQNTIGSKLSKTKKLNVADRKVIRDFKESVGGLLPESFLKDRGLKQLIEEYPASSKGLLDNIQAIKDKILNVTVDQSNKIREGLDSVVITPEGNLDGELGKKVAKWLQGNNFTVQNGLKDAADNWYITALGKDHLLQDSKFTTPIVEFISDLVPTKYFRDAVSKFLGKHIDEEATIEDAFRELNNWNTSTILSWNLYPAIRDLTQPFLYSQSKYGGTSLENKAALTEATTYLLSPSKWKEFWASGLKQKNVITDFGSDDIQRRIANADSTMAKLLANSTTGTKKLGFWMIDSTDTVARFLNYFAPKIIAKNAVKSGKKMNHLLVNPELRHSERLFLANEVKNNPREFVELYAKTISNKTTFIYDKADRAPYLKNSLMRLMVMFSKYPTEITQRYGRLGKSLLGSGKKLKGERGQAASMLVEDLVLFSILDTAMKANNINFIDFSPLSAINFPGINAMVTTYQDIAEGRKSTSEAVLDMLNQVSNPVTKITRNWGRMMGEDENTTAGISLRRTDPNGELTGFQSMNTGAALSELLTKLKK